MKGILFVSLSRGKSSIVGVVAGLVVLTSFHLLTREEGQRNAAPPECRKTVTLASSPEKSALLEDLAGRYNRDRECGDKGIKVLRSASGTVYEGLAYGWEAEEQDLDEVPQVWSPASTSWITMLLEESEGKSTRDGVRIVNGDEGRVPSVAETPVVLAMPKTIAEDLERSEREIGWSTLQEMADDPEAWLKATGGKAGGFKLGRTDPNYSTTGLAALLHAYAAAGETSTADLGVGKIEEKAVRERVRRVEAASIHYGETTLVYLCNLLRADFRGKALDYVSAVPLEEKTVYDYNRGDITGCPVSEKEEKAGLKDHVPEERLVPVHPREGTLLSDAPYAILSSADEQQKRIAEDFLGFLLEGGQQDALREAGFRGTDGRLAPEVAEQLRISSDAVRKESVLPSAEVIEAVRESWDDVRKPTRILLAVDVSGSMEWYPHSKEKADDVRRSRLGRVREALKGALEDFGARDEVGLWEFSGDRYSDDLPYRELVEPKPMRENKKRLEKKLSELRAGGDTALYVTIRDAYRELAEAPDHKSTAIVVLSDGHDFYKGEYDLNDLKADISAEGKDRPVRVFTIAYSNDAPLETLMEMAGESGGYSYNSSNPKNIDKVLREVAGNF
ncbi:vWA domain-containing protein [Streptomyces pini]|uniref:Ca-activated chloride channel family protein n=1 Tax=Streptomyces pini TaxID=1520580 RepID=A0A1I4AWT7_9ACTN|nr:substrate-binding domain-containing protein [Streptomyces pini]SFK60129.1 Ca-activated chloride channel family protein [Streptomyces pini]